MFNPKSKIQNPKLPRELVRLIEAQLRAAGCEGARAEAEWLVAEALAPVPGQGGLRRTELYLAGAPSGPEALERLRQWAARRVAGEPLAYVTGFADFCGHRLQVSPAVLIPRPETEVITEQAVARLHRLAERREPRVLELGAGSGNIAISLALAVPSCVVVALELSWKALRVAQANVERHRLAGRVRLVQADWSEWGTRERFDLIVSNPPYVSTADVERLPRTVRWEPRLAVDGGADGLDAYRAIGARLPAWLAPGGIVGVECGETQCEAVRAFCARQPWAAHVEMVRDLAGRPRGLFIESA